MGLKIHENCVNADDLGESVDIKFKSDLHGGSVESSSRNGGSVGLFEKGRIITHDGEDTSTEDALINSVLDDLLGFSPVWS